MKIYKNGKSIKEKVLSTRIIKNVQVVQIIKCSEPINGLHNKYSVKDMNDDIKQSWFGSKRFKNLSDYGMDSTDW